MRSSLLPPRAPTVLTPSSWHAAREHAPVLTGSYDVGDPLTTNLHVGGLPTNVTEQSFGKLFAQFGPVGSVKVRRSHSRPLPLFFPRASH